MSELHALVEQNQGISRYTLRKAAEEFHKDMDFVELSEATKRDYNICKDIALSLPTKLDTPLGDLAGEHWSPALVERTKKKIAQECGKSMANHVLRWLRRTFRWAKKNDHWPYNIPTVGVDAFTETPRTRCPDNKTYKALIKYGKKCGKSPTSSKVSCPPYLWPVLEIAYQCRLQMIEVLTLTEENASSEGLQANRRKGSNDTLVLWSPRLSKAWNAALQQRATILEKNEIAPKDIPKEVFLTRAGKPLQRSSFDSSYQRFIKRAIEEEVISAEDRFSPHDLKRKGITDMPGTLADKQQASGHKSMKMVADYDQSVAAVKPAKLKKKKRRKKASS